MPVKRAPWRNLDKEKLTQLIEHFDKCGIAGKCVLTDEESSSRFTRKLMECSQELLRNIPKVHDDPNVCLIFAISLLTAAWTGCLPRAKLFETPEKLASEGKSLT